MAAARLLAAALSAIITATSAIAQSPTLTITGTTSSRTFTQQDLLAHPAIRSITVTDPVYRRPMTYRAIPLPELLKGTGIGADDYLQARAIDNFSVSIPGSLATATSTQIEGFLAVETPAAPWPSIPGKPDRVSAGPFYIVWRLVPPARVSSEYWAYRLAALAVTDSPLKRWPGLAVGADVPAGDPIRIGLDRFVALCMACHRFNGAGEGEQGPDLGRPMNVTQYFQIPALKKLIRDPASVRRWPEQKMPGFDRAALSDSDLDAIVDWLAYKAKQKR
ncbi:MAG: cytochrome c [Chloroflexi bacterium]|jgi:mono/diheme cytochrome c family protein|nr:cytochrome c [Chloroflexota bacterium]